MVGKSTSERRRAIDTELEQMNILIPADLKRELRVRGAEMGISMAEAARRAIEEWVKNPVPVATT